MTRTPRPIRMRMMGRTMLRPLAGLALSAVGGRWSVVEVDGSRLTVDRAGSAGSAAVVVVGTGSAAVVVVGAGSAAVVAVAGGTGVRAGVGAGARVRGAGGGAGV